MLLLRSKALATSSDAIVSNSLLFLIASCYVRSVLVTTRKALVTIEAMHLFLVERTSLLVACYHV